MQSRPRGLHASSSVGHVVERCSHQPTAPGPTERVGRDSTGSMCRATWNGTCARTQREAMRAAAKPRCRHSAPGFWTPGWQGSTLRRSERGGSRMLEKPTEAQAGRSSEALDRLPEGGDRAAASTGRGAGRRKPIDWFNLSRRAARQHSERDPSFRDEECADSKRCSRVPARMDWLDSGTTDPPQRARGEGMDDREDSRQ